MKQRAKIILAFFGTLIMVTSALVAVIPRENCDKTKALSISSDILSDKIDIHVSNNSACTYEGFLWVELRDSDYKIPREGGQFAKLYKFNPKSSVTYSAGLPTLIHGKPYNLVAFVNEKFSGEPEFPTNVGERIAIYDRQFVFGEG